MKKSIILFALVFFTLPSLYCQVTLALWNFPNSPDNTTADGGIPVNLTKEISTNSSGTAVYLAGATSNAIANTGWDNGSGTKYWQVTVTTTGYSFIRVSSRQQSSGNGPRNFKLQYSTDGTNFYDVPSGSISVTSSMATGGALSNLPLPDSCNDKPLVTLRWTMSSNTPVTGATVAAGGFNRIDDILIIGFSPLNNGDGSALLSNEITPLLTGTNIFPPAAGNQKVKVTVYGVPTGTLTSLSITIPSAWTWSGNPSDITAAPDDGGALGNKTVTGNGSQADPYTVTFNGTFTDLSPARVIINGLTTPASGGVTDDGNHPFIIRTAKGSGTLSQTLNDARALVIIPLGNIRDNDNNGVPLDLNKEVAVQGVANVPDSLYVIPALNITLQDPTGGVTVFFNGLRNILQGNSYVVKGTVIQFFGLTEVNPSVGSSIIDMGPGQLTHLTVTAAQFNADPEKYEGRLIVINNVTRTAGDWPAAVITSGGGTALTFKDGANTPFAVLIDRDTQVDGNPEPVWPRDIRGVPVQMDTTSPFLDLNTYYVIPRTYQEDFAPANSLLYVRNDGNGTVPHEFMLYQNFPNPFNPSTTFRFSLSESGPVTLRIYDAIGREAATVVNERLDAGISYERSYNASHLSSGIYFATLTSGGKKLIRKVLLLK